MTFSAFFFTTFLRICLFPIAIATRPIPGTLAPAARKFMYREGGEHGNQTLPDDSYDTLAFLRELLVLVGVRGFCGSRVVSYMTR
jgi:hypothetical protein